MAEAPQAPLRCPHCGSPLQLDPMPPMHECARCPNCWMRSPRFPRYRQGLDADGEAVSVRGAVEWVRGLAPTTGGRDLGAVARALLVAYDRRDLEGVERAIDALREAVPARGPR